MPKHAVADGTGFEMNYEVIDGLVPGHTLFIHGNLASNRWWIPVQDVLRDEAKGRGWTGKFIAAEFRGCGGSSAPKSETEVDMRRFADDYLSLIRALNVGPVNLVGHSTGGLIAALMLSSAPELFGKAVFLDPVGARGVTFDDGMIGAFQAMKTDRALVATVMNSTIHGNDPATDFFDRVVVEDAHAAVKTVGHLVLKALDRLDVRAEVEAVRHPVLVLHGEVDPILPSADAKEMAALMPAGRFEILAGRGHCANVEDPKLFVRKLREFLF